MMRRPVNWPRNSNACWPLPSPPPAEPTISLVFSLPLSDGPQSPPLMSPLPLIPAVAPLRPGPLRIDCDLLPGSLTLHGDAAESDPKPPLPSTPARPRPVEPARCLDLGGGVFGFQPSGIGAEVSALVLRKPPRAFDGCWTAKEDSPPHDPRFSSRCQTFLRVLRACPFDASAFGTGDGTA